jgi:hypothetical protein
VIDSIHTRYILIMSQINFAKKIRSSFSTVLAHIRSEDPNNVTEEVFRELDHTLRALYGWIDEETRIKDLQNSDQLRHRMIELFKDEKDENGPAKKLLYLKQISQDKCSATESTFALGSTIYRSTTCEEQHYVCKKHRGDPCLFCDKKKPAPAQESQEGLSEKHAKGGGRLPSQTPIKGNEDFETSEVLGKSLAGTKRKKNGGDEKTSQEKPLVGETLGGAKMIPHSEGESLVDHKKPDRIEKNKNRDNALEVKDVKGLSVDDLDFKSGVKELTICQVQTKDGDWIWVILEGYVKLKEEHAKRQASEDEEL